MRMIEIFPEDDTTRTFEFTADGTWQQTQIPTGVLPGFSPSTGIKMAIVKLERGIGSNATMGVRPSFLTPVRVQGEYIVLHESLTIIPVLNFLGLPFIDFFGDAGSVCTYTIVGFLQGDGIVSPFTFPTISTAPANGWRTQTVRDIVAGDEGNIEAVIVYHAYDVSGGSPVVGYRGIGHTGVLQIHQRGGHFFRIVPVDSNDQYESYRGTNGGGNVRNGHECGYIKKGYGYVAQELEVITPPSTQDQWNDLDVTTQTADNAIVSMGWIHRPTPGALFEVNGTRGNLRQQGNKSIQVNNSSIGLCNSLDSAQVLETWITESGQNFYIEGYLTKKTVIKTQNAITKSQNALIKAQ